MSNIIQILLEEHRNIDKLLLVLEHELEVFDRSEEPDYEILRAIIQYFQDYPENCHHPKEDMVFEKLKMRDPAAASRVGDVEAEHVKLKPSACAGWSRRSRKFWRAGSSCGRRSMTS